jgi:hypothetical protein
MTSSFELLNTDQHRNLRINTELLDTPENRTNITLVTVGELSTLVHEYPVFITKSPTTGQLQLAAILGFNANENLYLQDNKWQATYLPLDILRRPFQAYVPDSTKLNQGRIAIDISSTQVSDKEGAALFDDKGEATDYLKKVQSTFAQLMAGTEQTKQILAKADELKLIESIDLNIEIPGVGKTSLNGLLSFNKEALTALKGDDLQQAHDSGILQVSHLILSSSLHLQKLINWSSKSTGN